MSSDDGVIAAGGTGKLGSSASGAECCASAGNSSARIRVACAPSVVVSLIYLQFD
jgi:hypothetical protein